MTIEVDIFPPRPARLKQLTMHRSLARFNARRLSPRGPDLHWSSDYQKEQSLRMVEHSFVEDERANIAAMAATVPRDPDAFVTWFESLKECGEGQHDPLFPWLAEESDWEDMCWFIAQEAAGEAGFDDLVAMTQLKLPVRAKLELARNYWDEMGRGQESVMHGRLLERLVRHLKLSVSIDSTVWPALAVGNLMVALASDRHYAYHSIGALGVVELTAPGRVTQVNAGLKRLGIAQAERRYFELHAVLDLKHSQSWNVEVLRPLVQNDPQVATWIAEGALMRLAAGALSFACYRAELCVPTDEAACA